MKIKKGLKIILEGTTLKDKINIILTLLGNPREVKISNSDGKFKLRANKSDLWMCSPLGDEEMRKYFHLSNGIFIDVGANIGKYSILVSKNKNVKVYSFEPDPDNLKSLRKHLELNKRKNVEVQELALSNKEGKRKFYCNEINQGNSSFEGEGKEIIVKTKKLDNFVKEKGLNRIDLIKIDVEGFEKEVLEGSKKVLEKFHPKIIFEANSFDKYVEVKAILEKFKYKISKINKTNFYAT